MDTHSNHSIARDADALPAMLPALPLHGEVDKIVRSISMLLSRFVPFESVVLLLLADDGETMQVCALEDAQGSAELEMGTRIHIKGTALESALEAQTPLIVPHRKQKAHALSEILVAILRQDVDRSYILPVSVRRQRMGLLVFSATGDGTFSPVELEMMQTFTSHISTVLENALVLQSSEMYRRQLQQDRVELQQQRDRSQLLLEVNNHIIQHLDVNQLLRAASVSIRDYFQNDFSGFWLFDDSGTVLDCICMDFAGGKGFFDDLSVMKLRQDHLRNIKGRVSRIFGQGDMETLSPEVLQPVRAEGIQSIATAPLPGSVHSLGLLAVGSRRENAFNRSDLDLLVQVANQISLALDNALAYGRLSVSRNRLEEVREYLESEFHAQYNFEDIVGKSPALKKALEQVAIVAPTDSTVLLIGETGTGKELIARAIHNLSKRADQTFVRLNCAAIPQGLMESELFGHEKGAFTGALAQRRGRVELAHEGTLFLDEIGDVDLQLQPKLLRVLQEREFERLGSNRTIKVNIRLIAATHRNLPDMVGAGDFREDLYYRLNVFPVHVPSLRERKEDIPLLVHYFVELHSRRMHKCIRVIPRTVMDAMLNWHWPGNVRELQNFIERSVILSPGDSLEAPIPELIRAERPPASVGTSLQDVERDTIVRALRAASGKLSGAGGAAERLGLKRTTLQRKMERLQIGRSEYV